MLVPRGNIWSSLITLEFDHSPREGRNAWRRRAGSGSDMLARSGRPVFSLSFPNGYLFMFLVLRSHLPVSSTDYEHTWWADSWATSANTVFRVAGMDGCLPVLGGGGGAGVVVGLSSPGRDTAALDFQVTCFWLSRLLVLLLLLLWCWRHDPQAKSWSWGRDDIVLQVDVVTWLLLGKRRSVTDSMIDRESPRGGMFQSDPVVVESLSFPSRRGACSKQLCVCQRW